MKLIIIRHGESIGNTKRGFISGRSDPDGLTLKGKSQIIRTAWELKDKKIDKIITSPVFRAQETARILNTFLKTELQTDESFTELHHGAFEGNYWWEIIQNVPTNWRENREDFDSAYPGGGESMKALVERTWEGLQNLFSSLDQNSTTIIVSHQAVIGAIRFCLEHGNPNNLKTKDKIDAFVSFMHSSLLSNGGYLVCELNEKLELQKIEEYTTFKPLPDSPDTVSFYVTGHFDIQHTLTIEPLETASSNGVYKVVNTGTHMMKIFHDKSSEAAERQTRLYTYLQEHEIPGPHIELNDMNNIFYKDPVLIQDYIEGDDQRICQKKHHDRMKNLLKEVYDLVERIHRIPVTEVKNFWFPQVEDAFLSWKPFMTFNINFTLHHLHSPQIEKKLFHSIEKSLQNLKDHVQGTTYKLVPLHGDLATGNLIISHTGGTCRLERIIDFEWARIGDPLWDYAYYWGWLERVNKDVAAQWYDIVTAGKTQQEKDTLHLFRVLFHAWTVRDMFEYKKAPIRERRGKASLAILESNIE